MAEGKLTVGVDIDAEDAFDGFADAVLAEVRPALAKMRQEIDKSLGGSSKTGRQLGQSLAKPLAEELRRAGDAGSKELAKAIAAGLPAAQQRVDAAARGYAAAMASGGREAANRWASEFQNALQARDALAPFAKQAGESKFGSLGSIAAGSFIGTFSSVLATKGLSAVQAVLGKITNAIQGVLAGGWERLTSIDTAKTKMEALGNSAAQVELVMANALTAVKGTAFGLQDAATVAATALAAGVKPGESLVKYLKLVADTAAITRKAGADMGAEFNDVGSIINKITTQGYATNQELQMLSDRGLPIYQKLSEAMRIGTGDVIAMAEKTGVAASQVRDALENTVGGAALKMGESFEGSMENARAALSRLGEALLKPLFEPAKDGVSSFTKTIDELTAVIVQNGPQITRTFEAIAVTVVEVTSEVLRQIGSLVRGMGEIIAPLGDVQGAVLKFQAWQAEIRGDDELAKQLRSESEAAFGWGDSLKSAGEAMQNIDSTGLTNKIRELGDTIAFGQQTNLDYAESQKQLQAAFAAGTGEAEYARQMAQWQQQVRDANARGQNGWSIPIPLRPEDIAAQSAGAAGGMPADVAKKPAGSSAGGDGKDEPGSWLAPGQGIPTVEELLQAGGAAGVAAVDIAAADLPDAASSLLTTASEDLPKAAVDMTDAAQAAADASSSASAELSAVATGDLPNAATGLKSAADAITAASERLKMPSLLGMGGLNPQNVPTTGLKPQSLAALQAIQSQFPDIPLSSAVLGRENDPYEWHPGGRGLDFGIPNWQTPAGKARGDALNAYILANKDMLGVAGTLWQVADHYDHVHVSIKDAVSPLLASMQGLPDLPAAVAGAAPAPVAPPVELPPSTPPVTLPPSTPVSLPAPAAVPSVPGVTPPPELVAAAARFGLVPSTEIDYNKLGLPAGKYVIPGGVTPPDPAELARQQSVIDGLNRDLVIKEQRIREMKADAAQSAKLAAANEYKELQDKIKAEQAKLEELKKGTREKDKTISVSAPAAPSKPQPFDFGSLPYGHPAKVMAGVLGGLGVAPGDIESLIGGITGPIGQLGSSAAGPIGAAAGSLAGTLFGIPLPGPMGYPGTPTAISTDPEKLLKEGNPFALAQMAGIDVPDYSRAGGGAVELTRQGGPASDAMGRIYSDTAALVDRTFTSLDAAEKARHDQVMTVLNEVRDRLAKDYVEPVTSAAVTAGIDGISQGTTGAIGQAIGQAAAPPIAAAVKTPSPGILQGGNYASGGAVIGPGSGTSDSILARVSNGEWVLTANQVAAMGGFAGVSSFLSGLPRFATGGGVDVSATVGAELFGVGQVPILSTIINLLVSVLLKLIGVQIEARDTLTEITDDFRDFRGEFKAFDAMGRVLNDTSGLVDRSMSSEQAAVDERIRILKLVLEGLLKWLIEKIIVPISKAVANTAIQIGAQAVNGAITGGMGAAFPGGSAVGSIIGGMASSAITSAGAATVDIVAEIGTMLAESILSIAIESIGELFQSSLPDLALAMFSGGGSAAIWDPLTSGSMFSGIAGAFSALAGGLATLIPGMVFDNGGVATGTGLMPKATLRPERVLSPQQTESFDRLVAALTSGRATASTTIHAPFTVTGGERGGREVRDRLLALMS